MPGAGGLEPRKRPRQKRAAATVAAILTAAAQVLERHGMAGFTTNAVAARAGVSIGSLYQYFPNKAALVAALSADANARLHRALAAAVDAALDLPFDDGLALLVRAGVARQLDRPALQRALDAAERQLPLAGPEAQAARVLQGEILRFLAAHADRLAIPDPALAAADLQALARALIDAAAQRGETDAAAIEARVLRTALGYLDAARSGRVTDPAPDRRGGMQ